jgi:hypothetical protein
MRTNSSQIPAEGSLDSGYSLIELVVSSLLLAMMIFAVSSLSVSGGEAQEYARRLNRVTEVTQELVDDLRLELVSSVRLFGDSIEGNQNLACIDLEGAPTPMSGLRLPTIAEGELIREDTIDAEITGNSLFFAKLAWSDRFICSSSNEYLVDVYRWVYYYLTSEDGGPNPIHPIGINIVRVASEPLIDAASIDRITDLDDQSELLLHLLNGTPNADGVSHDPAEIVWVRGGLPLEDGSIRQIVSGDGSLSMSPIYPRLPDWQVLREDADVRGMLSYRHHSVASIYARDSFGVSRYAVQAVAGEGFPHGFEVQIVGPSSARQILIHMVNSSTQRRGQFAWCEMQVSVDAREL